MKEESDSGPGLRLQRKLSECNATGIQTTDAKEHRVASEIHGLTLLTDLLDRILSFFSRGRSKRKWSLDSNIKGGKLRTKERAVARDDYTSITAPCLENDKQLKGS